MTSRLQLITDSLISLRPAVTVVRATLFISIESFKWNVVTCYSDMKFSRSLVRAGLCHKSRYRVTYSQDPGRVPLSWTSNGILSPCIETGEMKLSSPLISWEHLLITNVSRSHPAVTWTGLVTDTSTRVVEEELGTHGVLITGLLFFPAGTAFIPRKYQDHHMKSRNYLFRRHTDCRSIPSPGRLVRVVLDCTLPPASENTPGPHRGLGATSPSTDTSAGS